MFMTMNDEVWGVETIELRNLAICQNIWLPHVQMFNRLGYVTMKYTHLTGQINPTFHENFD